MGKLFTPEELEELRRADEEIEESFSLSAEDWKRSKQMDREARMEKLDNRGKKTAAKKAAYRDANREKIAAYYRANRERIAAYREANRERIAAQKAAYYKANRENILAYAREYRRKRREAQKAATDGANMESG